MFFSLKNIIVEFISIDLTWLKERRMYWVYAFVLVIPNYEIGKNVRKSF